ncbi:MAG TPA: carboxypeptidase-like regulatory domain-containing protein, partial [Saprospiraceae bacterium]|nr:carboxypeptidase-like regulatory domain-containing protein [Saprospiraceae bacterium]
MSAVPLCLRTLSALFIGLFLCAQAAAQRLRIWVADADNGQPIASATVALSAGPSAAAAQTCSTDAGGWCVLEGLRPGYHSCTVTAAGFDTQQLAEVYVAAG